MRAYRIYDQDARWAKQAGFDPLDGEGAMHGSARWHRKGTRVAYAACVASLALLEILVHVNPGDFGEKTLLTFDVPNDALETLKHAQLIQLLRDAPGQRPEDETRRFGTTWAQEHRTLALRVPSIVMPQDHDLIVNPLHPRMNEVARQTTERITLDPRPRLERLRESGNPPYRRTLRTRVAVAGEPLGWREVRRRAVAGGRTAAEASRPTSRTGPAPSVRVSPSRSPRSRYWVPLTSGRGARGRAAG